MTRLRPEEVVGASDDTVAKYRAIGGMVGALADVPPGGVSDDWRARVRQAIDEQHESAEPANRRSWLATLRWAVPTVAAVLGAILLPGPAAMDCSKAVDLLPPSDAFALCQSEYEKTRDPSTGLQLAQQLLEARNLNQASAIAFRMLETTARADATHILGLVTIEEGRAHDAVTILERARTLHRDENKPASVARDAIALARAWTQQGRYPGALLALEDCRPNIVAEIDPSTAYRCQLTLAQVLSDVGMYDRAARELDRARPRTKLDQVSLRWQRGLLATKRKHTRQAIIEFRQVIDLSAAGTQPLALAAHLHLADLLGEVGEFDQASHYFARAAALDVRNEMEAERSRIAARLAYHRGNLSLASSTNERAYAQARDPDALIEIAVLQVRIALDQNDFSRAAEWAQRGVGHLEQLRSEQSIELDPWIVSSRRKPYELLFVAQARMGRDDEAALTLDDWAGQAAFDDLMRTGSAQSIELREIARRIGGLESWLSSRGAEDRPRVLPTNDTLALVIANGDLWRVTARRGRLRIANLGRWMDFEDRFARFRAHPIDRTIAGEVGRLLLTDDLARPTGDALHVLLDAPLTNLPIAALRYGDLPLVAVRPVVRILRLADQGCVSSTSAGTAVLADPNSDLPGARREATEIAARLGVSPLLGSAATADALFGTTSVGVLHVAVHGHGDVLTMHDRAVLPAEIAKRKLGPTMVVLSSSADARSLAGAFLAAGSARVIASVGPITDVGAAELMTRFYQLGGIADPVRVLAKVQAALAPTSNTDWPYMAVFGHDICRP